MDTFFSQDARMGRLTTTLGQDVLVLQRFEGADHMNALFDYQVDCLAGQPDVDFDALIGTHATVTLSTTSGDQPFDGIITEARWLGAGDNGHRYRLRLEPWLRLAALRRNQRIFHNKTVVDILTELLGVYADAGKLTVNLTQDYPELEYTVQYRESDLQFATRLMERHGISYYFTHDAGAHEMVLSDLIQTHPTIGARPFKPAEGHHQEDVEHFWEWQPARRITTGAVRLTDYNFKTPNAAMEVDRTGDAAYSQGQIESFDWPGDHLEQTRGKVVAQLRADAERGQDRRFEAQGDIAQLSAGQRVELIGDPVPGTGEEYLCLSAIHSYTSDNYGTGGDQGSEYAYTARYILMPATAPLMPEHKTPRADVKGPQTAVVVGDGEIDCDEYGRILVQFHWDLEAAFSMRCRVSQNWAGNGWGGMVIPRIGMEVLVEFLDGDPDKPMVTGCVYNGRNKVPYDLPQHKTRSTFRTDTHEGKGFNELRFEDKNGKEEIFVHAEKDYYTGIEDSSVRVVGNNSFDVVQKNAFSTVANMRDDEVGLVSMRRVGFADFNIVSPESGVMSQIINPAKRDSSWGEFDIVHRLAQAKSLSSIIGGGIEPFSSFNLITGSQITTIGKDKTLRVGGNDDVTVSGSQSVDVEGRVDLTSEDTMTQTAGETHETYAGEAIVMAVGEATIVMTKDGDIEIAGRNIKINGTRIDLN